MSLELKNKTVLKRSNLKNSWKPNVFPLIIGFCFIFSYTNLLASTNHPSVWDKDVQSLSKKATERAFLRLASLTKGDLDIAMFAMESGRFDFFGIGSVFGPGLKKARIARRALEIAQTTSRHQTVDLVDEEIPAPELADFQRRANEILSSFNASCPQVISCYIRASLNKKAPLFLKLNALKNDVRNFLETTDLSNIRLKSEFSPILAQVLLEIQASVPNPRFNNGESNIVDADQIAQSMRTKERRDVLRKADVLRTSHNLRRLWYGIAFLKFEQNSQNASDANIPYRWDFAIPIKGLWTVDLDEAFYQIGRSPYGSLINSIYRDDVPETLENEQAIAMWSFFNALGFGPD